MERHGNDLECQAFIDQAVSGLAKCIEWYNESITAVKSVRNKLSAMRELAYGQASGEFQPFEDLARTVKSESQDMLNQYVNDIGEEVYSLTGKKLIYKFNFEKSIGGMLIRNTGRVNLTDNFFIADKIGFNSDGEVTAWNMGSYTMLVLAPGIKFNLELADEE